MHHARHLQNLEKSLMFTKIVLAVLVSGLLIGSPAQAQTVGKALEQAWSRHPIAASSAVAQSATQARVDLAGGLTPGPASLSLSTLNDQLGANRGKQEWELEIDTPLWLPGQHAAAQVEAHAAIREFDARQLALRLQLAGEVRDAWWKVAEARGNYALIEARSRANQTLVRDVERRVRAGELARIDLNLAQIEQLASQSELDDAKSSLQQAEQNFQFLTGETPPLELLPEMLSGFESTAEANPQVQAAAAGKNLAQAKLALVQKSQRDAPTLAIRMVRDRSDFADTYADAFGVKLTIPFSWGARVRQDLDNNRVQLVQAETEYEQTLRRTTLAIEAGQRQLKTSQQQLELATRRAALTQDNLSLMEKSFALGESDLPSLLRVRATHFDAQAQLQRQQINAHATVSRINQSLGVLP